MQVCELSHWDHSKCGTRAERYVAHMVGMAEPVGRQCFVQPYLACAFVAGMLCAAEAPPES